MNHSYYQHVHDSKHAGSNKHIGHSLENFKKKFWLSLLITLPVLLYSEMIQHWLSINPPKFSGSDYIPFIFSTFIFLYGGVVFVKNSKIELKNRQPGMMTLISMAITSSYIYSVATQFFIVGEDFFWELATLITIMLLGHWLEMSAVSKAKDALEDISSLLPDKASRLENGKTVDVLVSELKVGDQVLIRPGSRIPVDGVVISGESSADESLVTGESKFIRKEKGNPVVAGTNNQDGSLTIQVTKMGQDTVLAGIRSLVTEAQSSKSNVQILADRAAYYLTIIAIASSIGTFIIWLIIKDITFALERAVTVLVIACPHALGLAIPLVVSISTSIYAKNGLLVRKRLALESARNLDWVLFDKTGTLTKGHHEVVNIWGTINFESQFILKLIASIEQKSEHSIGKAIVVKANKQKIKLFNISNFKALPGIGVTGVIDGTKYIVASKTYIAENNIKLPIEIEDAIKKESKQEITSVYLVKSNKIIGALGLADTIRSESRDAIININNMGVKTAMVTGDLYSVAKKVADDLGINIYFAEVKPGDKVAKVKELQKNVQKVAFVGDGINDAPALTQADIGIAIGAGTDIAIKSADIILTKSDPGDVVKVIKLSKLTYRKMVQNLIWATGYNIIAIPLAAGIFYGKGIVLVPAVGAALMSVSTIVVAINAQLLRLNSRLK